MKTKNLLVALAATLFTSFAGNAEEVTVPTGSLPRIDINIVNNEEVTSKEVYLKAKITIDGKGYYDNFSDSTYIKGRGNTSWGQPKKPYRLKLYKKGTPFGLTKAKSWVLLANYNDISQLQNVMAMKAAAMVDAAYHNHMIPCELYMNGSYRGVYDFTEKVGIAANSVDIDEATGVLVELDSYYDETYKFHSAEYYLPVNIKDPDLTEVASDVAEEKKAQIKEAFNRFEYAVKDNADLNDYMDVDMAARYLFVYDLMSNYEVKHPKSVYLSNSDYLDPNSKFTLGPVWDFDWCCGFTDWGSAYSYWPEIFESPTENGKTYTGLPFFYDLANNPSVKERYLDIWREFFAKGGKDEFMKYLDDMYAYCKTAFRNDEKVWRRSTSDGYNQLKSWMTTRLDNKIKELDMAGVEGVAADYSGEVVKVEYVSPMGVVSDKPFTGVNVIRTTYDNGAVKVEKRIVK